jgi:hypothetical protein
VRASSSSSICGGEVHPKIIHEGGSCYCNLRFGNKVEAVRASSSFVAGRSGACFSQSKRSGGKAAATERERERERGESFPRRPSWRPLPCCCCLRSGFSHPFLPSTCPALHLETSRRFVVPFHAFCCSLLRILLLLLCFFSFFSFLISSHIFFVDWWCSVVFEVSAGPGTWTWPFRAMVWGFDENMLDLWLLGLVSYAFSSGLVISVLDILAIRNHAFFFVTSSPMRSFLLTEPGHHG